MKPTSDNRYFVDECFTRLHTELGTPGLLACEIVVEVLGGLQVHVPSRRTLELEARDRAIRRAWKDGYSFGQIADKLRPRWPEISVDRVRRIVRSKYERV